MVSNQIRNVVFDIGNVMVRWSPEEIVRLTFGSQLSAESLAQTVFHNEIWQALNKGQISEAQAKWKYQQTMEISELESERLFYYIKQTQIVIFGSIELLTRIKSAGYHVYALTDNVTEIVSYLKSAFSFWSLFDGAIVSAEVGLLKPQPEIYQSLLNQYQMKAVETVFIDDMPHNVQGAKDVGMSAIQFENAAQCEEALKALGLFF